VEHVVNSKLVKRGRPIADLAQDLFHLTGGWPRRVGDALFVVTPDHKAHWLTTPARLFAWARAQANVAWAGGPDLVPAAEFFHHLQMVCQAYDTIEPFPHFPPVPGAFYLHPPLPPPGNAALAALLSRFAPDSHVDAQLLRAFVLTLFWGGPPGQRPAWLFTGPENDPLGGVGVGKSACVQLLGDLVGGCFEVLPGEDMGSVKKRLLSRGARHLRLARIDNIKQDRLDWADLDGLLTAPAISGYQLYQGEGRRPNYLVWALTVNTPSLSRDLAKRSVVVRLQRPTNSTTWLADTRAFVEANRWQIIADVGQALA
jgi:hypothetical protein